MRKAALGNAADGAAAGIESIARGTPCPYAEECEKWLSDDETESAECAHCGQVFDRRQLALILAGRA